MKAFVILVFGVQVALAQQMHVEDCIKYALAHRPEIKIAEDNVYLQQNQLQITQRERLPSLGANFSQSGSLGRNIDPFSNDIVTSGIAFNSLNVSSSINIFNGYRQRFLEALGKLEVAGALLSKEQQIWNTKLEVIQAYFNWVVQQKAIDLKKVQIRDLEKQMQDTKELIAAGQLPKALIPELDLQLGHEFASLLTLENASKQASLELSQRIFWKDPSSLKIDTSNLNPTFLKQGIHLNSHPNVLLVKNQQKIQAQNANLSLVAYKPSVSFSLGLGTTLSSAAPSELSTLQQLNGNFGQFVSVNASFPLYNKGQKVYVQKKNAIQNHLQEKEIERTRFNLEQEVQRLQNDLDLNQKRVEILKKQVQNSQLVYVAALEKFKAGILTTLELSQRQTSLFENQMAVEIEQINLSSLKFLLSLY